MKITVRNLGVIQQAEIDLKPLTIFVGPNNSGKTWLAYTFAGIFGQEGLDEYLSNYIAGKLADSYPPLDTLIQQVLNEGNARFDLVQFADEYGEVFINNLASQARQWMRTFLSTELAEFNRLAVSIDLAETKHIFLEHMRALPLKSDISVGLRKQSPLLSMLKKAGENTLFIYTSTEGQLSDTLPDEAIRERLLRSILRVLHEAFYPHVYTFPTERTTFFILFPSAILSSFVSRLLNSGEKMPQGQAGEMIGPLAHFLDMIMTAFQFGSTKIAERAEKAKQVPKIQKYLQLAHLLEEQILNGEISFSTPEPDPRREVLFTPTDGNTLEISIASGMAKELSPLVLYLRYLAEPGDLLIIDEPEMNLHPEAQARLIEFLAMLVHDGLQLLITTHSPYVVDHLANLMKAAEATESEAIQNLFYLQQNDAFISKNDVSAYLVDQGRAENILDEDGIIHWSTFGNVSDHVTEIYFAL